MPILPALPAFLPTCFSFYLLVVSLPSILSVSLTVCLYLLACIFICLSVYLCLYLLVYTFLNSLQFSISTCQHRTYISPTLLYTPPFLLHFLSILFNPMSGKHKFVIYSCSSWHSLEKSVDLHFNHNKRLVLSIYCPYMFIDLLSSNSSSI